VVEKATLFIHFNAHNNNTLSFSLERISIIIITNIIIEKSSYKRS